jgi:hypothetical protein
MYYSWVPKCDTCGRFMKQESGASWVHVPGIDVPGHEFGEERNRCKSCTDKHERAIPFADVKIDMCSGIYK